MKKYFLLIALVAVVSGCVGGGPENPNNAIVINDFSVDPGLAEVDDIVYFFLDVENVGGTTAGCVTAELFGIESWYDESGQPLSYMRPWRTGGIGFAYSSGRIAFNYWDPMKGFMNIAYDRRAGLSLSGYITDAWGQFTSRLCSATAGLGQLEQFSEIKSLGDLRPAVPAQGKPGQSFTAQWIFKPPVLPEGVYTTYPVTARVSYLYTTNAHINLQAFNKAEEERRRALGEPSDLPLVVTTSHASPIQIAVVRGRNPIIVNQRQPNFELANYLFEFRNIGNGWPLPFESDVRVPNGFIFATVELSGPGAYFYDCLGARSGNEVFVSGDVIQNLVKLRSDRRAPFSCTIAVDRAAWADKPMGTISLTFNLWYRYYTDAQTAVDVLGPQESI